MEHDIHELFVQRRSPYAFAPDKQVSEEDMGAVFEAARWTMSSYNAQPWRYIVARKDSDPELWDQVFDTLVEGNKGWAKNAPVLVLGIVEHVFEYNGKTNKAAIHDLGAASAFLTLEATARGLIVHQMIGIEPDKAKETFGLTDTQEAFTALAIGYPGKPEDLEETFAQRDSKPRERKALADIILSGGLK